MSNEKDTTGKRIFNDVYSFPQDSQDLANDIYDFANARVGTSAQRQALPVAQRKAGMLWSETDTGSIFRVDNTAQKNWVLVIEPELRPTTVNGGTVDTYGGIVPQGGATTVRVNGVFSPRFRIYRVQFWLALSTSSGGIGLHLTAGGIPHTAANYAGQRLVSSGNATTSSGGASQTAWAGTGITGSNLSGEWVFRNPASQGIKSFAADAATAPGSGFSREEGWLGNVDASVFDGFQFTASSGNFMGGFVKVQPQG